MRRFPIRATCTAFAVASCVLSSSPLSAGNRYLEVPPPSVAQASRAHRYANMTDAEARTELLARRIPFTPARAPLPGVRLPVRLGGPLHGVSIHSVLPPEERAETPFEILDARLALALDDFCRILARHDVVEVVHFTMYRPPTTTPKDRNGPQTRHPGGLAIDVGALRKRSGEWIAVGPHWPASLGARTCGTGARRLKNRKGRELMSIVCETHDARIFHFALTPHFDKPHSDHLHLEIKPEVQWFLFN